MYSDAQRVIVTTIITVHGPPGLYFGRSYQWFYNMNRRNEWLSICKLCNVCVHFHNYTSRSIRRNTCLTLLQCLSARTFLSESLLSIPVLPVEEYVCINVWRSFHRLSNSAFLYISRWNKKWEVIFITLLVIYDHSLRHPIFVATFFKS